MVNVKYIKGRVVSYAHVGHSTIDRYKVKIKYTYDSQEFENVIEYDDVFHILHNREYLGIWIDREHPNEVVAVKLSELILLTLKSN
jgi:hypothetical protein